MAVGPLAASTRPPRRRAPGPGAPPRPGRPAGPRPHTNRTPLPADALPRIFEPFYTTKEVGKGTGLGLAIAYGIVLEHGGQIVAANHPAGGAVFTVELPAGRAARREKTFKHD